jgi:putative membrane protein (TIGR04086 family)
MSAKSHVTESSGLRRLLRPAAVGVVAGAVICAALLALMSLLLSLRSVPQSMLEPMAVFAMCVGAFTAGGMSARIVHKNGLGCGLFTGLIFSAVLLVCGFAVPGSQMGAGAFLKTAIVLMCSMLGGVLGVNSRKK